ncbi:hypothetical protein JXR93_05620, partial [bacterium]|nr:hypothetical protein [bacterium]
DQNVDDTAEETLWESRSLPAYIWGPEKGPFFLPSFPFYLAFYLYYTYYIYDFIVAYIGKNIRNA